MNKILGSAIGAVFVICLILIVRQSGQIGQLKSQIASLRQGQDDLGRRQGQLEGSAPRQLASAVAAAEVNPVFKGVVTFADAKGRPAATFDPVEGLTLLNADGEKSVVVTAKSGGSVRAGSSIAAGSLSIKDAPSATLAADDSLSAAVFSGKSGATIKLASDSPAGPSLLIGRSVDKEDSPMVKLSGGDKESLVQVLSYDAQGKSRSAQLSSNGSGASLGLLKDKQAKAIVSFTDSDSDNGAYASFSSDSHQVTIGENGLTLFQDKQKILAVGFDKFGGDIEVDAFSGEQRIHMNVSEDLNGIIGLFGPNGRSTVIGHSAH